MARFSEIVGQGQIKEHLQNAIQAQKISHAYILSGEKASGKEFVARAFAQTLQCERGGMDACCECHSCKQAESRNHPDIIYVTHEKTASIGVDDIRDQISGNVSIKPYSGKYKIYIINEAEKMTVQAQNALLKTLEEPPAYVVIMLLTNNSGSFLQTIRSRCVELSMKPVAGELLKKYLMEEMQVPDYRADVCVAFAQGNFGKAKDMALSDDFTAVQAMTLALAKNAKESELVDMVKAIKDLAQYKVDPQDFLDIISVWYRDILLFKATGDANHLIYREDLTNIRRIAQRSSYEGIEKILEAINTAKIRLNANVNFELTMELLMLTIKENG